MNLSRITFTLIIGIASISILVLGKEFIIPMILAIFIWFLIKEIRNFAAKTPFIGLKSPKWLLSILSTIILFSLFGIVINILIENINNLTNNISKYEKNLSILNEIIISKYKINIIDMWSNYMGEFDFTTLLTQLLNSITELFGNAFMIGLYILFLFFEESAFTPKLKALYPNSSKLSDATSTIEKINKSISKYITLKTVVSIITGSTSYLALTIIGVDTPLFWAFLIFILNYIPTIGSLIATIFPATIALLQFGDLTHFFFVLGVIGAIQIVVGNIIEPKMMGNSLNVSSLVVILSLSFWGIIWGITGMVLSVPITVIIIILFSQFPSTKSIAILLSEKGEID
jgi:AI-2 transport protein TqsA